MVQGAAKLRGFFLSVEGVDRTGKTGVCRRAALRLRRQGFPVYLTADPPMVWKRFKETHLEGLGPLSPEGRAFGFVMGRVNEARNIFRSLAQGKVVISDRYNDSWLAYQPHALRTHFRTLEAGFRELSVIDVWLIRHGFYPKPDKTLLIVDSPTRAARRAREAAPSTFEGLPSQRAAAQAYDRLARNNARRIERFDLAGREPSDVFDDAVTRVVEIVKSGYARRRQ